MEASVMSNAIVQMVPGPMQVLGGPPRFSPEQRKLILDTCCGGASETEAKVLIAIAEARNLNPLLGECYFVKRWATAKGGPTWAVQASIDAFRIKAEETGDYGGQDAPSFERNEKGEVVSATVRVYRKSVPGRPFAVGVAYWDEYVQRTKDGKPTRFWSNMPHNQLAKCAEALAFRKAFPKVLARIYTPDEMQQADSGKDKETPHDPQTGEVQEPKKGKVKQSPLCKALMAKMRAASDVSLLAAAAAEVSREGKAGRITLDERKGLVHVYEDMVAKLKQEPEPGPEQDPEDPREAEYEAEASANE
jgi:phage recombination protein Bet